MTLHKALISRIAAVALGIALAQTGAALADEHTADLPGADTAHTQLLTTASPQFMAQAPVTTDPAAEALQAAPEAASPVNQQQADQQYVSDWSFEFNPSLPIPLIGALAGMMALMAVAGATGGLRRNWLWASAGGALVLTMATPQVLEQVRAPLGTTVLVVTDNSTSQSIENRSALTADAQEALVEQLEALPGVEVRLVEAGEQSARDEAAGTHLFGPAREGLADIAPDRLGAVFMLTDGQVHDLQDADAVVDGQAPLHGLVSGRADEIDRRIEIESAPVFGLVDEEQTITYRIHENGMTGESGPVNVRVTVDGEAPYTRSVMPGEEQQIRVPLGHAGENYIALEVEEAAGELTTANNRAVAEIKGVRDNMRVLLISGEPNPGERAWRSLLKTDPTLDLVHMTILRTQQNYDTTPVNEMSLIAFPSRELFVDRLDEFDLVVFDHFGTGSVMPTLYLEYVAEYVERGGAVLVASGPEYGSARSLFHSPLQRVLPVAPAGEMIEQPFRPEISGDGLRHPVTRGMLENGETPQWGEWFRVTDSEAAVEGHNVMQGANDEPLMVLSRQGEGRVAMLMSDHSWLWQRGYNGGGPYATMMQRMAHWLLEEPSLEEEALRLSNDQGQLTIERQTMSEDTSVVTLESPSGEQQQIELAEVEPGLWRATVTVDELGLYKATQDDLSTMTNVGPVNPAEYVDTRSTVERLAPLAAQTGGGVARMANDGTSLSLPSIRPVYEAAADTAMSGDGWMGVKMSRASDLVDTQRIDLLGGWVGYALTFGLMAAAFIFSGTSNNGGRRGPKQGGPGKNGPQPG